MSDVDSAIIKIEKQLERIADALEGRNKISMEMLAMWRAEGIAQELKQEDAVESALKVDTKIYDGIEVKEEKKEFTWYILSDGKKVRKCNNEPCPFFLKYNDETGKYEHGDYDMNSNEWTFKQHSCKFWKV